LSDPAAHAATPAASPPEQPTEKVGFADPYTRYVMFVLFLVYVMSYVDRQLASVLLEDMKADLGASDAQMGLLTGVAFAVVYATLGVPIARLADSGVRRNIIAVGLAVWSAATALTGAGRGYFEVLMARLGVGAGESAAGPPGHALLSDYFPLQQRGRALALYSAGGSVGMMLGLWLGGYLGDVYGWRAAFVIVGLPGLALALLVRLTVREPQRGRFDSRAPLPRESIRVVLRTLWETQSFKWMTLAATLHVFAGFGASTWNPAFLMRLHGMSASDAGFWLGPVAGIGSFSAGLFWGYAVDIWGKRDLRWYMWLPTAATLVAMPFSYAFVLWPNDNAVWFLPFSSFFGNCYAGATFAMVQGLAKPHMRAMAAAGVLFVMNLGGLGLGPTIIGFMNDWLEPHFGIQAIRVSLLIIGLPHILAAVFGIWAARTLREEIAAAQS
jgi:predicted MFS family arabinose efflux permease